jgi:hypothetical protein
MPEKETPQGKINLEGRKIETSTQQTPKKSEELDMYQRLALIGFKFGTSKDDGPFWIPKDRSVI